MNIVFSLLTACLLVCMTSPPLVQAGGGTGEAPYEIGLKLLEKKHYKTARVYFQKALKRNDERAHYGMGLLQEATGKDGDALNHFRLFIDLGPPDTQRRDAAQRVAAIEERLKQKTTRVNELLGQGKSLFRKGRYRDAERVLLKAASEDESKPEVHFTLGEVYMKLENYPRAKSEYEKARGYF